MVPIVCSADPKGCVTSSQGIIEYISVMVTLKFTNFFFINLQAPNILYIGQAFRYSPENASHIFNQHFYFII